MDTKLICSVCGKTLEANAPEGLCPECLLKVGMGTGVDLGADTESRARRSHFVPPTVAELAPHFPQLEILELIGQGGMGAVYRARQKELDRIVALKILPPDIGQDPAFAERFTREARALAKLNHPGIVTLYEFGRANLPVSPNIGAAQQHRPTGQLYFFLMEYVDGVNLRQLLLNGRVSPHEALAIVPQICDALQFAHDRGIVHRDIKPENILMDRRGRAKVADFGLAKIVENQGGADLPVSREDGAAQQHRPTNELTDAGKVMGTPQYMSPEQITAPGEVDHRADIYALGVVFYQMLTGELPGRKIEPPSKKVHIDVRLDEVVLRALEKKPELRYQQASILKTQVETIASTPGSSGRESAPTESVVDPESQSRLTTFTAGSIGFASAVVAFYAGVILSVLMIESVSFQFKKDMATLLGVGLMLMVASFVGAATANTLRHVRESGDSARLSSLINWFNAASIVAWLLSLPAIGFTLFFLSQLPAEFGHWNPSLGEAVVVPLTWFGAVFLPLSFWRLASNRVARGLGLALLGVFLVGGLLVSAWAYSHAGSENVARMRVAQVDKLAEERLAANRAGLNAGLSPAWPEVLDVLKRDGEADAVKRFISMDWAGRPLFASGSDLVLTEDQFSHLSSTQERTVSERNLATFAKMKQLARAVRQRGLDAQASGNFAIARRCFESLRHCGRAMDNSDRMLIVRMVGQSIEKLADDEPTKLSSSGTSTNGMSFGPVMERELPFEGESAPGMHFIGFKSGRVITPQLTALATGDETSAKMGFQNWMHENGADAVAECNADGSVRLFGFKQCRFVADGTNTWSKTTPEGVIGLWADGEIKNETRSVTSNSLPDTFIFKTHEGTWGFGQITSFTDNPRGVNIRYKLVQNCPVASTTNYPGDWIWEPNSQTLAQVPPIFLLRPSTMPTNAIPFDMFGNDSFLSRGKTLKQLIARVWSQKNSTIPIVFETNLPDERFDFIVTHQPDWPDKLQAEIDRRFNLMEQVEHRMGKEMVIVKTSRNEQPAQAADPAAVKTVVLTRATNQMVGTSDIVRTVTVWTDTFVQPGERIAAEVRFGNGKLTDLGAQTFINWEPEKTSVSSAFTWWFGNLSPAQDFSQTEAESALDQIQKRSEEPIRLVSGRPLELFSVTNRSDEIMHGYLEFTRTLPAPKDSPDAKVQAVVHLRRFEPYSRTLNYDATIPPGYALRATANQGQVYTIIAKMPPTMGGYRSVWSDVLPFKPKFARSGPVPQTQRPALPKAESPAERWAKSAVLKNQFQALLDQGSIPVILGEPKLMFSTTNSAGEVYQGFLELVGPTNAS